MWLDPNYTYNFQKEDKSDQSNKQFESEPYQKQELS